MTIMPSKLSRRRRRTARALLAAAVLSVSLAGCASLTGAGGAGAGGAGGAGGGIPTPAGPIPDPQTAAQAGAQTIVAIAPPAQACCKKQTLPEFLGLDAAAKAVGGAVQCVVSRLATALDLEGRFPGLQATPPLLPITDPANMNEDAPPVLKAAAGAKAEEDTAPQKIMAIRYLAQLGCGGCYPNIEDAILASLDDCTEAVRYEAAAALRGTNRSSCHYCNSKTCCSNKVQKKLQSIAFEMDKDGGCPKEPSPRVRRMARLALQRCGGLTPEQQQQMPSADVPEEGPIEATAASDKVVKATRVDGALVRLKKGAPEDDVPEVRSALLNGVRLASLTTTPKTRSAADPEVARVNGEPIYESQVAPQLERVLQSWQAQGIHPGPEALQVAWQSEVRRAADVKLLTQRARQDLISQRKLSPKDSLAPERFLDWYEESLPVEGDLSMLELTQYYQQNQERFLTPARVRWETITLFVGGFRSRDEAFAVMQSFRARAQGFPVAEVPFSRQVVQIDTHDWTSRQDVKSKVVGETLFSLPVGKLSPILDEGDVLHLVRVLERQTSGVKPFDEVAATLRRELLQQRVTAAEEQYVARVRQSAQVVTIFDSAQPGQPARVARLPKSAAAVLQSGEPTPAVPSASAVPGSPTAAPTVPGQNAGGPNAALPSVPASAGNAPVGSGLPAESRPVPAIPTAPSGALVPPQSGTPAAGAPDGARIQYSPQGTIRQAAASDVGEPVRPSLHLESRAAPPMQRVSSGPSNIPNRRPSAAVTGPRVEPGRIPPNATMTSPGDSAVR